MKRFGKSILIVALGSAAASAFAINAPLPARSRPLRPGTTGFGPGMRAAAPPASATPQISARGRAALNGVQRGAREPFDMLWDAQAGVARMLGPGRSRSYGKNPEQAGRAFLRDARNLLDPALNPDQMPVASLRPTAFGQQVTFQQAVQGLPVVNRTITINLTDNGEVLTMENSTNPVVVRFARQPRLSSLMAAGKVPGRLDGAPALAIDADQGEARLVWRFISSPGIGQRYLVHVDAQTGEVLRRDNLIQHATGRGFVYRGNPISTPTLEELDLPYLDGTGKLTGSYTRVYKYGTVGGNVQPTQPVVEPSLNFRYAAGDNRLAQVEAYYGITSIHDYYKNTLGFSARDHQIPAVVQVTGMQNAYYSSEPQFGSLATPNGYMAFGISGSYDYALDMDVLYHEYTHAVVDKLNSLFAGGYTNQEPGGANEGLADYFACSLLGDPDLGEYIGLDLGASYVRTLNNRNHFPEDVQMVWFADDGTSYQDFPEVHRGGEVWGPAVWDLRKALGAEKTDKIVFKAMSLFSRTSRFQHMVAHILTADKQLYGGANAATIKSVFNRRGFRDVTEPNTAYGIDYLNGNSFNQSGGTNPSRIRTGYVYTDNAGVFRAYDPGYFESMGLFPSFVADRYYALQGYTADSTVRSVFLVVKDSQGRVVTWTGADTEVLPAKPTSSSNANYGYIGFLFQFPGKQIAHGINRLTNLTLYLNSYTQKTAVVAANFAGTTPKSSYTPTTAPLAKAQILRLEGDVDASGMVEMDDAMLVWRAISGKATLTEAQKYRADIVAPYTGQPDKADVQQIIRVASGAS